MNIYFTGGCSTTAFSNAAGLTHTDIHVFYSQSEMVYSVNSVLSKNKALCLCVSVFHSIFRKPILFYYRSCFEFLQKVFLGLMYPFSCVLWAINSKQLLSFHHKEHRLPQRKCITDLPAMKCGKSRFPHAKGVFFLPIFSSIKKAAISPMPPPINTLAPYITDTVS